MYCTNLAFWKNVQDIRPKIASMTESDALRLNHNIDAVRLWQLL